MTRILRLVMRLPCVKLLSSQSSVRVSEQKEQNTTDDSRSRERERGKERNEESRVKNGLRKGGSSMRIHPDSSSGSSSGGGTREAGVRQE